VIEGEPRHRLVHGIAIPEGPGINSQVSTARSTADHSYAQTPGLHRCRAATQAQLPTTDLLPAAAVLLALPLVGVLGAVVLRRALVALVVLVVPAGAHMVSTGQAALSPSIARGPSVWTTS
jgi:hypothetical protein